MSSQTAATTTVTGLTDSLMSSAQLDLTFIIDATGSMGSYIAQAQATIRTIVEALVAAEKADLRFALISYRDHPPQDSSYVVKTHDFTSSISTMRANLDTLSASGGGDGPESVVDGLHAALKLPYRSDATKVCILIADAPPHGLGTSGDGFPNGCPCGLDPIVVCQNMAKEGIALHCIGCEPSLTPYREFFMAMAHITGGLYCPLGSASALENVIVGGVREEMNLEKLMTDVHTELASAGLDSSADEESRAQHIWSKMREKKVVTKQLKIGSEGIAPPTAAAVAYSKCSGLSEIKKSFKSEHATTHAYDTDSYGAYPASDEILSAAPPARKSFMGGFSLFSKSSTPKMAAPVAARAVPASMMYASAPAPMYSSAPAPPSGDDYKLTEDTISLEQCRRMVQKSSARTSKY